jgi:hypothetical protein
LIYYHYDGCLILSLLYDDEGEIRTERNPFIINKKAYTHVYIKQRIKER